MKKILFIVTQSEYGGAQRYVFEIASRLEPEKYDILIAAGEGDGELFKNVKCQMSNVKCFYLKYLKRTPNPCQILFSIWEIFALLKREKPDVLFLCSTTVGLLGSLSFLIYKIHCFMFHVSSFMNVVYRIGGWAFQDPRAWWQNKIILLLEKLTAKVKDKIIVNSEIDRQLALKYKIAPTEKVVKIHNGIDANSLNFLSSEEARKKIFQLSNLTIQQFNNLTIIGTIANFYKTKGLEYLIEAAHILNSKFITPNSKFVIIGEGRQRPQLESLIKKYGLEDKVLLVGRIADAYKYLKAFDIFVLPSQKEGFPWIILEAMAAELPLVATEVGALPEIINDGINGWLVKPKDSHALAEKIVWFVKNPGESKKMGERAREKAEKEFPLQKMLKETEKILKTV